MQPLITVRSIVLPALLLASITAVGCSDPPGDRGGFVTTLGRDTVVEESFARTAARIDGNIVVRVPGTVLLHYLVDLSPDGAPTRSVVNIRPLGTTAVAARTVAIQYLRDSMFVDVGSAGNHRKTRLSLGPDAVAQLMTGFGSSYGLYVSPALYETYSRVLHANVGDTVHQIAADIASGRPVRRVFVRRSPTSIDADYFGIGWTRLTVDGAGRVTGADATQTTEQTRTTRTGSMDVPAAAARFAAADRAGRGVGIASPAMTAGGNIGGHRVKITYSSPRRRNRTILGGVVPYDDVWRTGANAATQLFIDTPFDIGGTTIPAGAYSLWTVPKKDGSVNLIINTQHGQWGTDHDASRDFATVPMHVSDVPAPRDDFTITVAGGTTGAVRISWGKFVWSVPMSVAEAGSPSTSARQSQRLPLPDASATVPRSFGSQSIQHRKGRV